MQRSTWYHQAFPLPLRVVPKLWEDLPSLLTRTAVRMGYPSPQWILRAEEAAHDIETINPCLLYKSVDYQYLQRLLSLGEETLYQCTYHRFAHQLRPSGEFFGSGPDEIQRPLLGRNAVIEVFHPYLSTKVCPLCLAEEHPYGRLYWNVRPVVLCPQHHVFLVDRCPRCLKPIPLLRPSPTCCPRCHAGDYRAAQAVVATNPLLRSGQRLTLERLGIQGMQVEHEGGVLANSPLLDLLPWQYFLLFNAFRHILSVFSPDDPFLPLDPELHALMRQPSWSRHAASSPLWPVLATTVPFIFASWPEHFFAFLQALIRRRDREGKTQYEGLDFGRFRTTWLYNALRDPAFSFLREAYEAYLKRYYIGQSHLAPQDRLDITVMDAQAELGISLSEVKVLMDRGLLRVLRTPTSIGGKKSMARLERASVATLLHEWEGLLPLRKVTRMILGVNSEVRLLLEQLEWLLPMRGPLIDGYPIQLYQAAQVNRLVTTLLHWAVKMPLPVREGITLFEALFVEDLTPTDLLADALQGRLTLIDTGWGPLFERLLLPRAELHGLLEIWKRKREERGLLSLAEAAAQLDVKNYVLVRWVRQGFLHQAHGDKEQEQLLLLQDSVETFRHTYVSTREAARLLGVRPATVYEYVAGGLLHRVRGQEVGKSTGSSLFLREEIEALVAITRENGQRPASATPKKTASRTSSQLDSACLTMRQTAALLGVSRQRVHQLIQAGRLPYVRQGVYRVYLLRSDVEAFRQRWTKRVPNEVREESVERGVSG